MLSGLRHLSRSFGPARHTNLRLPGQYDERLLGSLGLQGPYYNWNRWYLPGVGRYLELDPIALRGGLNGDYGPDWYGYAGGNPLGWFDVDALSKTQNLRGNDEAYREFVEAAKKGRQYVTEVYEKYKAMYERGEMGGERWKNIRAWWKTAKDGRILGGPLLLFIDPEVICGPNLERCHPSPQCADGA